MAGPVADVVAARRGAKLHPWNYQGAVVLGFKNKENSDCLVLLNASAVAGKVRELLAAECKEFRLFHEVRMTVKYELTITADNIYQPEIKEQ